MILKKPLWFWALTRCRGLQVVLLVAIVLTVFLRVFPLEMQKRIVNEAIRFGKIHTLFLYCGLYMGAVLLAGLLKYFINVLQGYIGQKILYELRIGLYRHLIRLPIPFYRRTSPGLVISSVTGELASVGDFLGGAIAVPAVNVLTLVTFGVYMFTLNPILTALSLAVYPIEILIIPRLQNRFNRINSDRVTTTRKLSSVVGEAISGIQEIHANAGYDLESRKVEQLSQKLLQLRHRMNLYRYGIKFTNNFFQSLGPFLLFLLGGYFSITGRFSLGALVAFLSAYEKLYDPWKELMEFYQGYQDARVAYRRIQEAFDVEPEFPLQPEDRPPVHLGGAVAVEDLVFEVEDRVRLLDQVSLRVAPGERLALVGLSGSGKSTLAMVMAQLYRYNQGHVYVDQWELKDLTKADVSPHLGFVSQYPFIFDGTLKDNILYGKRALQLNTVPAADHEPNLPALEDILHAVDAVGLTEDVLRFGLNSVLDQAKEHLWGEKIVALRHQFRSRWSDALQDTVEFFDMNLYLDYSSVAVNIIFGYPVEDGRPCEVLPARPRFRQFLEEVGLDEPLVSLGLDVVNRTVPLLRDLRNDPFFFRHSPIALEEMDQFVDIFEQYGTARPERLPPSIREALLALALRVIPGVHKMIVVPKELREAILASRSQFKTYCTQRDPGLFVCYSETEYLRGRTLLENILFGRLKEETSWAWTRITEAVVDLLKQEKLYDAVLEIGLDFEVGSKGDRLSGGQKQKVGIARALLKKPRILIMDEATASLDMASQTRIQQLLDHELRGKATVISVAHRLETIRDYDQIAVMKSGRIVELGQYDELLEKKGLFYELVSGHG
ncbi:ABC transporter transmembrane domain-containing protein [Desulfosoma caldarium]|uniref:Putative ABC transport system ATP-binding protein n=1 Tax=Desulfosoma caldarium TaxID=610254 RepID=A0A3N1UVV3_9BACT|nr:ABC transporter ATP-binding protein/permease [Desulfosoma caldarium]ROQ92041.1 putative ABC transport system ATP-binding protein [Desulfosoma caldarium]